MNRIGSEKIPKGTYIKVQYMGMEYEGICRGIEQDHIRNGYSGYNILEYINYSGGHSATNKEGETFQHCWWIERDSIILDYREPRSPANISELF